jgi:nucleotide-binding universal stress UspA family protein
MYQKALVPLDGSPLAECVLSHIKKLAKEGVVKEVTLLNVVMFDIPWGGEYPERIDINALREPLFAASRKYLAEVESRLASAGIRVKTESLEGNRPADTIVDYARKSGMDVIVIATHGYTGMKRLLLGSVAFGVLHESPIPVLLIRPESCRI